MAKMFEYNYTLGDGVTISSPEEIFSPEEIRELYRFPREIIFILTPEEYKEARHLLALRGGIEDKLRDLSADFDLTDRDSIKAYTKAFEDYKQTKEYKAVFPIIDRLEEIEETALNRFSATFEKPEDLYDAVRDVVQTLSLTLDKEQQRKSLYVNIGGIYSLPAIDYDTARPYIKIDPVPRPIDPETVIESTLKNIRLCIERNFDIQAMEIVCTRRRWSLEPIRKIIEARAKELFKGLDLDLDLESVNTIAPQKYVQPSDKISNELTALSLVGGGNVIVGPKGKEKIKSVVRLNTQGLEGFNIRREIDEFDRAVMDAITSLYVAGNEVMTVSMIHNVLTGNSGSRITEKKRDDINDSITRLIYTGVFINPEQERQELYPTLKKVYDSPLVNGRRVSNVYVNGTLTDCLRVYDLPILYEYANAKKQVSTIPIELLNSPIAKNKETIILQDYILRRVEAMKRGNISHTITYEAIYKLFGYETDKQSPAPAKVRVKQKELREKASVILDHLKTQKIDGKQYIKGHGVIKKSGRLYGVEVKL